jgi:hypothetical protein
MHEKSLLAASRIYSQRETIATELPLSAVMIGIFSYETIAQLKP